MKPYEIWDYLRSRLNKGPENSDPYHYICLKNSIVTQDEFNKLNELFDKDWGWFGSYHTEMTGKDKNFGILYLNLIYKLICDYDNKGKA